MENAPDLGALMRAFVPPRGLDRGRPRDVRLTAGGRAVLILAVLLIAGGLTLALVLNVQALHDAQVQRVLTADGVEAHATVLRVWRGSGDSKRPWVAYEFHVDGARHQGEVVVPLILWRTLHPGSDLRIRYLAEHPDQSTALEARGTGVPLWLPYVAGLPLALAGVLCLITIARQRRLLRDGRGAPAIVTAHFKRNTGEGGTRRYIRYAFPLLNGSTATGKSEASRPPPPVGSVITVVYDPDNPARSVRYPLALARLP